MLYIIDKQAYKLELPKKWKIYNIFYLSLLEQNSTRKEQVDKIVTEYKANNSNKYKIEAIWDSIVYANKTKGYLLGLYYLVV